jgi:hypothetical protein
MLTIRSQQMQDMAAALNQPPVVPCDRHWIEISMIDENGQPIPQIEYKIQLPDGTTVSGRLDENGSARFNNIVGGQCNISFPQIDADAWEPAA